MKLNWGTGIFLTLVVFLIGMITLVIISSSQNLNLVSEDYYPESIDYQQHIDKMVRTKHLPQGILLSQDANNIYLKFPIIDSLYKPQGKVLVFRPANNHSDKSFDLEVNDSLYQIISKDRMFRGRGLIKVDFSIDTVSYYHEESMMIY
jgi:hypothetical protein